MREYADLLRVAVTTVAGRVPLYAGVGGGVMMARDFAAAAAEARVDGVLLLPPYLVRSSPTGLLEHIRAVLDVAPPRAIVYQRANALLDPPTARALLADRRVVGVKDGTGDMARLAGLVAAVRDSDDPRSERFAFVNGMPTAELHAAEFRAAGIAAYSSATHCYAPDLAVAFHRALRDDDDFVTTALTRSFFAPFAELRDQDPGYAVALVKAGVRQTGLRVGRVRPPLVDPTPEHEDRLAQLVRAGRAALPTTRAHSVVRSG